LIQCSPARASTTASTCHGTSVELIT